MSGTMSSEEYVRQANEWLNKRTRWYLSECHENGVAAYAPGYEAEVYPVGDGEWFARVDITSQISEFPETQSADYAPSKEQAMKLAEASMYRCVTYSLRTAQQDIKGKLSSSKVNCDMAGAIETVRRLLNATAMYVPDHILMDVDHPFTRVIADAEELVSWYDRAWED